VGVVGRRDLTGDPVEGLTAGPLSRTLFDNLSNKHKEPLIVVEAYGYAASVGDVDLLAPRYAKGLKFSLGSFWEGVFAVCDEVGAGYEIAAVRV